MADAYRSKGVLWAAYS